MKKRKLGLIVTAMLTAAAALTSCTWKIDMPANESKTEESKAEESTVSTETKEENTNEEITEVNESISGPVAFYGEMKTDGNRIIGSKTGETVRVNGMSFFWSNWSQKYYTAEYVDLMAEDFGCEIVRFPYGIDDNGVPYDKSDVERLDTVIEAAISKGLYVIIDWHSHGAHKNPDEAAEFFGRMAEKYGSYNNVIFEIFNEPKDTKWKEIREYAETIIPVIREHSDNLIVVGTPNWSQEVTAAAKTPVEGENIAYALHFYAGTHKEWLREYGDKALAAGIPLFVTEWGSVNADGNGGIDKASTAEWLKWMDDNELSSCVWAVNDKDESSSIFVINKVVSETGEFIKGVIKERTDKAAWRE